MTETREHQIAFIWAWNIFNYSDEEAKIKAEEVNLNYIELALLKSELLGVSENERRNKNAL